MTISRRRFLCGCGSVLLAGLAGQRARAAIPSPPGTIGCALINNATAGGLPGCGAAQSTGNAPLDAEIQTEFEQQRRFFGLPNVKFQFLDDCGAPNAYAMDDPPTIWFGIAFARMLYTQYQSTLPLWHALAHEFGHQMQNAYGHFYRDRPTAILTELEADMFSGFYLGYAKNASAASDIQTILPTVFSTGDYAYNDQDHHGTPEQRVAAVFHGLVVAYEYFGGSIQNTMLAVRERFARSLPI